MMNQQFLFSLLMHQFMTVHNIIIQWIRIREIKITGKIVINIVVVPCTHICIWHSNTDKIGKLKYMVKLESDIWSNSNMWSKLLPIYGQSQIYGQILYDQTQIHGQTKIMVIFPI